MVITQPSGFVAEVHDRMPVALQRSEFDQCLRGTPDEAAALMKPAPQDQLQKWPVSKRIAETLQSWTTGEVFGRWR